MGNLVFNIEKGFPPWDFRFPIFEKKNLKNLKKYQLIS
jgi:hypothetical protein